MKAANIEIKKEMGISELRFLPHRNKFESLALGIWLVFFMTSFSPCCFAEESKGLLESKSSDTPSAVAVATKEDNGTVLQKPAAENNIDPTESASSAATPPESSEGEEKEAAQEARDQQQYSEQADISAHLESEVDESKVKPVTLDDVADSDMSEADRARVTSRILHASQKKDTLESILRHSGFSKKEAAKIKLDSNLPDEYCVASSSPYLVTKFRGNHDIDIKIYEPDQEIAYVFRRRGKSLTVSKVVSDLETKTKVMEGVVDHSLLRTLTRKFNDYRVAQRFMSAFILDFDPEEVVSDGSKYSLTVEEKYYHGHFVKYGEILNAKLEINGTSFVKKYVRFGRGGAYVAEGETPETRPFFLPVNYLRVTSLFNPHRFHPIRRRWLPHKGVDFALPKGEPVYAAADGVVLAKGRGKGSGKFVSISHGNGYDTLYEHLSLIEDIKPGDAVKAGEKIGEVGCTGYCTSPHLHFAIRKEDYFFDPIDYLNPFPQNDRIPSSSKIKTP